MSKIIRILFFVTIISSQAKPSRVMLDINSLKPISHFDEIENVSVIRHFFNLEDTVSYGELPLCLNTYDPLLINGHVDWNNPESYKIKNEKKLYIAQLNDAFISPHHLGTIFDKKQQLLFRVPVADIPLFWPIDNSINNRPIRCLKKIATVQGPTLFYHWLIDRLPTILLLRDLLINDPEIKLLINSTYPPSYVFSYLELLGIPNNKIIVASDCIYYAHEVYFATPFLMEPIPKKLLIYLKNELLVAAQKSVYSDKFNDNLILIIQRKELDRRLENIDEIIDTIECYFDPHKYSIVIFDASNPIAEQIMLFNNAKMVIGVMASGLSNIIYCKPKTPIIEMHPAIGANSHGADWCWWLSSALDLNYWILPTHFSLSDQLVQCPINKLEDILKKITGSTTE